ncbi:hypothetical protein [Nocardia sp. BMG51109]|uniref:hypothetical protein n=1 Tax=Nocardia sp. BMG51109 TaxID=1056816 RepID=UPI0004660E04|nr:hypothetical protein [Nocardia sp. BMG51109]
MAIVTLSSPIADASESRCGTTLESWVGDGQEAEYVGGNTIVHLTGDSGEAAEAAEGDGWIEVDGDRQGVRYRLMTQGDDEDGGIVFMRSGSRYHLTSLVQPICSAHGQVTSAMYSDVRLERKTSGP